MCGCNCLVDYNLLMVIFLIFEDKSTLECATYFQNVAVYACICMVCGFNL